MIIMHIYQYLSKIIRFIQIYPYAVLAPVLEPRFAGEVRSLGSGVELETQVVQLRTCIETLERRLEARNHAEPVTCDMSRLIFVSSRDKFRHIQT